MNDDKELVEVWRAEFHEIMSRDRQFSSIEFLPRTTTYADEETFNLWLGFLMAKRSQPSVVLPKPEVCFGNKPFAYVLLDPLCDNLTAAGIKYKIGN